MPRHIATLLCHPTTTRLQHLLKTIYVSNKVTNSMFKGRFITLSNAKSLIFNYKSNFFRILVVATLMPRPLPRYFATQPPPDYNVYSKLFMSPIK